MKKLQAILKPMMLRRLKDDVEKNLAPKEETIIEVEFYKNKQFHKSSDVQNTHTCTLFPCLNNIKILPLMGGTFIPLHSVLAELDHSAKTSRQKLH